MSLLEIGVGWLAPPACVGCGAEGLAICDDCSYSLITPFGERCWRCNSLSDHCRTCTNCRRSGMPSHVWINTNYESTARDLIRKYKFGHLRSAAIPIAALMTENLLRFRSTKDNYIVVPVPTATSRVRERGFGHAELLAKNVAYLLSMPMENILARIGQESQIGSNRNVRLSQAFGQYVVKTPKDIQGRKVLLVDDVLTTGGTLHAASFKLRQAGAALVDALVFAKRL